MKRTSYEQILSVLRELKVKFPNRTIGQHLSTALDEYGNLWAVSDKEILFALNKYKATLEADIVPEQDIDTILRDGENLEKLFEEEDSYE